MNGRVAASLRGAMRVLVRVDATPAIGLGHAMRCLALVQELRAAGHAVWVATRELPDGVLRQYQALGAVVETMTGGETGGESGWSAAGDSADAHDTTRRACGHAVHWVLADGYAFDQTWQQWVQRELHAMGAKLALFDDEASAPAWHADLLINQNLGATSAAYAHRAGEAVVLAGAPFVLLREEFRRLPRAPRRTPDVARRVLITMGGADPANVTERVVRALGTMAARDPLDVRVLVGAANPHGASIEAAARSLPPHVRAQVLTQVSDMSQQMRWADMAVTAGGSTLWELAYMQLPALAVILADNQRGGVNACHAAGSVVSLGEAHQLAPHHIADAMTVLRYDPNRRGIMSRAGGALVDGEGAQRIVDALCAAARSVEANLP